MSRTIPSLRSTGTCDSPIDATDSSQISSIQIPFCFLRAMISSATLKLVRQNKQRVRLFSVVHSTSIKNLEQGHIIFTFSKAPESLNHTDLCLEPYIPSKKLKIKVYQLPYANDIHFSLRKIINIWWSLVNYSWIGHLRRKSHALHQLGRHQLKCQATYLDEDY